MYGAAEYCCNHMTEPRARERERERARKTEREGLISSRYPFYSPPKYLLLTILLGFHK